MQRVRITAIVSSSIVICLQYILCFLIQTADIIAEINKFDCYSLLKFHKDLRDIIRELNRLNNNLFRILYFAIT